MRAKHERAFARASLWCSAALVGCTSAAPGARSQSIVGGTTDSGDPSVLLLLMNEGGGTYNGCTAEVISPHVVLTAAHCVMPDPSVTTSPPSWSLYVGNVFSLPTIPPNPLPVKEVHTSPLFNYAADAGYGIHDIAVAIIDQVAPVPPIPYDRSEPPVVGAPTRLVGFGQSNGVTMTGVGTKRQTTTALTDLDADALHFADGQHQDCNGDSGGPAFQTIGGVELIIGVTSGSGISGNTTCTGGTYHTRVDTNSGFVDQYVNTVDPGFLPQPDLGAVTAFDAAVAADLNASGGAGGSGGSSGAGGAGGSGASGGDVNGKSAGCTIASAPASSTALLVAMLFALAARRRDER